MPATRARVILPVAAAALAVTLAACTPQQPPVSPSPTPAGPTSAAPAATPEPTLTDLAPGLRAAQPRFTAPESAVDAPGPALTATFAAEPGNRPFGSANVGLSFEARDLADERWDPANGYLDELVDALDEPSLRFGGNSVDRRIWWTSTGEPAPDWADTTLTPADFERLALFTTHTGATVTLVVNLGRGDAARAADYVKHAHEALGEALVGVSIGNEPNGFALASQPRLQVREEGYSASDFIAEARPFAEAIHAVAPDVGLVGPGTFDAPWWRAFGDAELPGTVAMSQHWYPLWSCTGAGEPRAEPTVANIVSPWLHDRAAFILGMGLDTADRYDLPLWLEETGPTSCSGGTGTSRTHAQALWTSDFTLHAASLGVRRANHHGMIDACEGGAPMSPLCDSGAFGSRSPDLRGQANYLALLQVANLRAGDFWPVRISGDTGVYAYAITDDDGLDVVVVNFNDPATTGSSPLNLAPPAGLEVTHASVLWADTLDVRNGTSLIPWSPTTSVPDRLNAGSVLAVRFERG